MRAYLSGAIEHAPDGGRIWRQDIEEWLGRELGHTVYNPSKEESTVLTEEELKNYRLWRKTDYSRFKSIVRRFIQQDLKVLQTEVDYIICLWDRYVLSGGGTHGELTMACHLKIPVYTVIGIPRNEVSAWILGCSTEEFKSFEELKAYLEKRYKKCISR